MIHPQPLPPSAPLNVRASRRALLLAATGLIAALPAGHRFATRAQDQPDQPATPTPTPSASPGACPVAGPIPVGCWVVSDISAFIESGLMDVTGIQDLSYVAAEGTLAFTFRPDGAVQIIADRYRVAVSAEVRFVGEVDTAVRFDGELTGRYTLAGEALTITAETPVRDIGIDNDDIFAGGTSRLVHDPDGQTLRLYPDPENETAIILTRYEQVSGS